MNSCALFCVCKVLIIEIEGKNCLRKGLCDHIELAVFIISLLVGHQLKTKALSNLNTRIISSTLSHLYFLWLTSIYKQEFIHIINSWYKYITIMVCCEKCTVWSTCFKNLSIFYFAYLVPWCRTRQVCCCNHLLYTQLQDVCSVSQWHGILLWLSRLSSILNFLWSVSTGYS